MDQDTVVQVHLAGPIIMTKYKTPTFPEDPVQMCAGKHIIFRCWSLKPKTYVWRVVAKIDNVTLGNISWFGRWNKYVFEPNNELALIFEETCLRDIAAFCEFQSQQQRKRRYNKI